MSFSPRNSSLGPLVFAPEPCVGLLAVSVPAPTVACDPPHSRGAGGGGAGGAHL